MQKFELLAETRESGEKNSQLRRNKLVPGIVYGKKESPVMIKVDGPTLLKTFRKARETHIISLTVGMKHFDVLVHDYQKDPITGDFIHIDFHAVDKNEKIKVTIPLHFVGESQAKKEGGAIEINYKEIEVRCLPADLVDFFEVSLESLVNIDDAIRISDLVIDRKKYEILEAEDEVVVAAHEIEEMKLEEFVAADASKVEVTTAKKDEEAPATKE